MINALVIDLIETSEQRILEAAPADVDAVRASPALIRFSDPMRAQATELKRFLHHNLYRHYQVNRMTSKARRVVTELFGAFMAETKLLPPDYQVKDDAQAQARKVADYIAGMTDRYAMREHRRLFDIGEL
jgi:dGTPase